MSLLNQMLKDLEARRRPLPPGQDETLEGVQAPVTPPGRRLFFPALLLLTLIAVTAGLLWKFTAGPGPSPVAQTSARQAVVLPGSTPPASQPAPALPSPPQTMETTPPLTEPERPRVRVLGVSLIPEGTRRRLVLEIDGAPSYSVEHRPGSPSLLLKLEGTELVGQLPPLPTQSSPVGSWQIAREGETLLLTLEVKNLAKYRDFLLPADRNFGPRLVLELEGRTPARPAAPSRTAATTKKAQPAAVSEPTGMAKSAPVLSPRQAADQARQEALSALKRGRERDAEAALRRALAADPDHLPARETLATLLLGQGRISEAAAVLTEGLKSTPGHLPFRKAQARILAGQGESSRALEVLNQGPVPATAADPDFHAMRAALQQRLGLHGEAARGYRELLAVYPAGGIYWLGLGISLEGEGQTSEAADAYREALLRPDLPMTSRDFAGKRLKALAP